MILITPAQCRAARALLNWSQPDLAERCGMHVQTISAFEKESGSPTKNTLTKIASILEQGGIELLPNNGVALSPNKVYVVNSYYDLLEDVLNHEKDGGEMLLHCADERKSPPRVAERLNQLIDAGVKIRSTICEGNEFVQENMPSKWLPKDYFANSEVFVIYADKFALTLDTIYGVNSMVVIKNKTLADAMRRQFEYWWKNGKPVPGAK